MMFLFYQTGNQGTCKVNANAVEGNVVSYGQLPSNDPVGMKSALVKYGVLMVGISATGKFEYYRQVSFTFLHIFF